MQIIVELVLVHLYLHLPSMFLVALASQMSVLQVTTLSQDLTVDLVARVVVTTDSATGAGQSVGIRTGF